MKSRVITALDIGSSNVRTAIVRTKKDGALELLGLGQAISDGIDKGVVKDIQALSGSISKSIKEAEKKAETSADNIYTNITGEHIKTQLGDGRIAIPGESADEPGEILPEHLEQVINDAKNSVKIQKGYERHRILHGLPHDYIIDSQDDIRNPLNMNGFHLTAKVLTILGDLTPIRNITKCIELAGYDMPAENFVLNHVALSHSILSEDERRLGAIIMDIGGGACDISIYDRGTLEDIFMIPMAGTSITEDLAILLKTTLSNAEYIKTQFGNAVSDTVAEELEIEVEGISGRAGSKRKQKQVSKIIQHRVEEMLNLVYNECKDYYTPELVTAGIILSGGSAKLEKIDLAIHQSFNMQVKIAHPDLSRFVSDAHVLDHPAFATLVGMLYYAMDIHQETPSRGIDLSKLGTNKIWDKIKTIIKDFH